MNVAAGGSVVINGFVTFMDNAVQVQDNVSASPYVIPSRILYFTS